jgi:flagellar biosynthetic protein FliQ
VINLDTTSVVEAFRALLIGGLIIMSPPLVASLVVATLVGIIQAVMQIQEQTLSFFPKLLALFGVIYFTGPWMFDEIIKLFKNFLAGITGML